MLVTLARLATMTGEIKKMLTYCSWLIVFEMKMTGRSFQRVCISSSVFLFFFFLSITSIISSKKRVSFVF